VKFSGESAWSSPIDNAASSTGSPLLDVIALVDQVRQARRVKNAKETWVAALERAGAA
jgi:hypothetical protein